jgi:hypothetical protein
MALFYRNKKLCKYVFKLSYNKYLVYFDVGVYLEVYILCGRAF